MRSTFYPSSNQPLFARIYLKLPPSTRTPFLDGHMTSGITRLPRLRQGTQEAQKKKRPAGEKRGPEKASEKVFRPKPSKGSTQKQGIPAETIEAIRILSPIDEVISAARIRRLHCRSQEHWRYWARDWLPSGSLGDGLRGLSRYRGRYLITFWGSPTTLREVDGHGPSHQNLL